MAKGVIALGLVVGVAGCSAAYATNEDFHKGFDERFGMGEESLPANSIVVVTSVAPAPTNAPAAPVEIAAPMAPNICPLNGAPYAPGAEKAWAGRRPLGVVIENHVDARPQSGLSGADVVYRAVAEGGITRYLGVFLCNSPGLVGPNRSIRQVFLDMIQEYGDNPLLAHVGGAKSHVNELNALGWISALGWSHYNDLDGSKGDVPENRVPGRIGRKVAPEHTWVMDTNQLWMIAASGSRGLTNVESKTGEPWTKGFTPYTYKADAPLEARPTQQTIKLPFWDGGGKYAATWTYDRNSNTYLAWNAEGPNVDLNNGAQLKAHNVVVLGMQEGRKADGEHTLYVTNGQGPAYVIQDGKRIQAVWKKDSPQSRTQLLDAQGKPISLNAGQTWFEIVGDINQVGVS